MGEFDKGLIELLIQAYDRKIDNILSEKDEMQHRYEQILLDFKREEILDELNRTKRIKDKEEV